MSTRGQHPEIHTIGVPPEEQTLLRNLSKQILNDRDQCVSALKCASTPIGCGKEISQEEFAAMNDLSRKEYGMSGLCQKCQDEIFGPDAIE